MQGLALGLGFRNVRVGRHNFGPIEVFSNVLEVVIRSPSAAGKGRVTRVKVLLIRLNGFDFTFTGHGVQFLASPRRRAVLRSP
jgi:hypothetical protein